MSTQQQPDLLAHLSDAQRAQVKLQLEGVVAKLDLAIASLSHAQARPQVVATVRAPARVQKRYDWLDHVSGISLADKLLGF